MQNPVSERYNGRTKYLQEAIQIFSSIFFGAKVRLFKKRFPLTISDNEKEYWKI